jgi:hypothetical protein
MLDPRLVLEQIARTASPFRHIRGALVPAALVILVLGPLFFRMAEGGSLLEVQGYSIDPYAVVLYAIFFVALVSGIAAAYRNI